MRTGLIAQKLGMTRVFTDDGRHVPVTVLKVDDCQVIATRTVERDGYTAVQLGVGQAKVKNVTKAVRGHFAKARVAPKRKVAEFRVSPDALIDVGSTITVEHFVLGQYVDVAGTSIGKGFAGVMKRHNFRGGAASHGSMFHRAPGSIGASSYPSRVVKGMRGPGRMGGHRVTVQSLRVLQVDSDNHLLIVSGAVPGAPGSYVVVRKAVAAKREPAVQEAAGAGKK